MAKKLIVGQSEWTIDEAEEQNVTNQIREAMQTGTSAELSLLDAAGRPVTVFLNAATAATAAIGYDGNPRPGEMA
jgi:hypothetical protein